MRASIQGGFEWALAGRDVQILVPVFCFAKTTRDSPLGFLHLVGLTASVGWNFISQDYIKVMLVGTTREEASHQCGLLISAFRRNIAC